MEGPAQGKQKLVEVCPFDLGFMKVSSAELEKPSPERRVNVERLWEEPAVRPG